MNENKGFLSRLFNREKKEEEDNTQDSVRTFAHRAGMRTPHEKPESLRQEIGEAKDKVNPLEQNSLTNAEDTFRIIDEVEIDVASTSDGVFVVTHDGVSDMTFEDFQEQHPDHATFESWVNWLKQPGMENKRMYLDLKGTDQDPFKMVEMLTGLEDRVEIGSKDPATVVKLLLARKLLGANCKVHLQIPEPLHGGVALRYAQGIVNLVGVDQDGLLKSGIELDDLKPDGLHFYWPEDIIKDAISEMVGHGQFAPASDQAIPVDNKTFRRWKGIPVFRSLGKWIQKKRLRGFVHRAKKAGYEVIAGSSGSPEVMAEMIRWGVDAIMPNDPNFVPTLPQRARDGDESLQDVQDIPLMEDKTSNTVALKEGAPSSRSREEENSMAYREATYKNLIQGIKSPNTLRVQFGF